MPMTADDALAEMKRLQYVLFTGAYNCNLIVCRRIPGIPNVFDDTGYLIYEDARRDRKVLSGFCTSDPGRDALLHPSRKSGAAIIIPGQHRASYTVGFHHNKYPCLIPVKPIPCWRDGNRDEVVDYGGMQEDSMFTQWHDGPSDRTKPVGPWSEGCIANEHSYFQAAMKVVTQQGLYGHGNLFTLTVLEDRS